MFTFCELEPMDYWEIQTLAKCVWVCEWVSEWVSEFLVYWAAYAAKKNANRQIWLKNLKMDNILLFTTKCVTLVYTDSTWL